jgi:hypothetical protein
MVNVLSDEKRRQVLALKRLEWSLQHIEEATNVRRETASAYLKTGGIKMQKRNRPPTKRSQTARTKISGEAGSAKPAISPKMSTDLERQVRPFPRCLPTRSRRAPPAPGRSPSASACETYRKIVIEALSKKRNAIAIWQKLVDRYNFKTDYASVKRFVLKLRGSAPVEPCGVITTHKTNHKSTTTTDRVHHPDSKVPAPGCSC